MLLITSWENLGRSFLGTISSLRSTIRFLNDSNVSGLTLPQSRKLVAKIRVVNLISGSGMLVFYYKCLVLKCEEIKNRFRFIGKISYRSYWTYILMKFFSQTNANENLGVADISKRTAIKTEDIISTLQSLGMVQSWKGQYVVHVKHDIIQNYWTKHKYVCSFLKTSRTFCPASSLKTENWSIGRSMV